MNIPLFLKYKPKKIKNMYYEDILINKLNNIYDNIENIILVGNNSSGKTCLIDIIKKKYKNHLHIYNFHQRGYDITTTTINNFIKIKSNDLKLIILDNIDNISHKSQLIISTFINNSNNVKFILSCNNINNINEAIQSSSIIIKLLIDKKILFNKLINICDKENIKYSNKNIFNYLITVYNYDIRKILLIIELINISFNEINIINIKKLLNKLDISIIKLLFDNLQKNNISGSIKIVNKLLKEGYSHNDILSVLIEEIKKYNINKQIQIDVINIINEQYIIINEVVNSNLQIYCCLSKICIYFKNNS